MINLERCLAGMMPSFYWFRDRHELWKGQLRIWGTVALSSAHALNDLHAFLGDKEVAFSAPIPSPSAEKSFWFLPPEQRFGILIEEGISDSTSNITATFCLGDAKPSDLPESQFVQVLDWPALNHTPPTESIERVSGKGATAYNYHNNGATDFSRFSAVALRYGIDVVAGTTRILDWGCGCGRLTRHFLAQDSGPGRVVGIDIDGNNVDWCKNNLGYGSFEKVDLYPPTQFGEGGFDLIVANSVLSHLKLDAMKAWLRECHRLLRPGGIALLSYHGNFSLCGFVSSNPTFVQNVLDTGFNASLRASELDDFIGNSDYYRQTFMTDEFARHIFSENFIVETIITGVVSRYQNLAVLRRSLN